jgi:hypothetical protein
LACGLIGVCSLVKIPRCRGWEYFHFVDSWSVDFCFDGLRVYDDDPGVRPRTLDPGLVNDQIAAYEREEHDSNFWRGGAQQQMQQASGSEEEETELEYHDDEVESENSGGDGI